MGNLCYLWEDGDYQRLFLQSCPWALIHSPDVAEVQAAHKWFLQNQLSTRYPDAPLALLNAVTEFDNGHNRGTNERLEKDRKEREAKAKREAEKAARQGRR